MIMSQHNRACQQRCYFPNLSPPKRLKIEKQSSCLPSSVWKNIFNSKGSSIFLKNLPNFKMGKDLPVFFVVSPKPCSFHPETPSDNSFLGDLLRSCAARESHRNRSMFVDLFFFQYVPIIFWTQNI